MSTHKHGENNTPLLCACPLKETGNLTISSTVWIGNTGRKARIALFMGFLLYPAGAVGIVESNLISSLVLKLKTEMDEIQELILDTLSGCLCVEAFEALATGAVPILKEKLTHPSVAIRSKAARALLGISVPLEGKNVVWDEEVIPVLVSLLEDSDPEVQANAAGALMNATITTQGKFAALNADAIPPLLKLVNDETSKVRLNAIKALTILSEAPEGRKTLLNHVDLFRGQLNDSSEAVSRAAKIAIKVIEWKP
ncbi:unnamed protein product [Lepidochelys kempii]